MGTFLWLLAAFIAGWIAGRFRDELGAAVTKVRALWKARP